MPNPYINNTQDLTTYIRTEDSPYKSRPILGASGLSIIKKDARWSFSFSHEGLRYHGTLGTYPTVSMKEAKAALIRKRFSVMNGYAPKPQRKQPIA